MWGLVISALGGIAGGIAGGIIASQNTDRRINAYDDYAKAIKEAAEKYSGNNAYSYITNKGREEANKQANQYGLKNRENKGLLVNNLNNNDGAASYQEGREVGQNLARNDLNAQYNAATANAKLNLDRANKEADVKQQMATEGMNTAGGLIDLAKNTVSDERAKEGLPEADAEDALRQIESIEYKYKPETGLDSDKHVGVTAQSLEGTAFEDAVVQPGENGNNSEYKALDKQKLLESVMAGIAALQKELDEAGEK